MLPGFPRETQLALGKDKRLMRHMLDKALEAAGGQERLNELASESDDVFLKLFELRVKMEPKEVDLGETTVEALLAAYEKRQAITDAAFQEVPAVVQAAEVVVDAEIVSQGVDEDSEE